MRRTRIEIMDIAERSNLALASWKAARGKRSRPEVAKFLDQLDAELDRLAEELLSGRAPRGEYRSFYITDPKRRLIHAACFPDRVLHHAILNLAEATFERSLVDSSFACRPGRGVHAAIRHGQGLLRRWPWYVKVDVEGYFPAIGHERLLALLARRFKGADFLALLERIVRACPAGPGRGLPIGALTSQHFANLYLDGADRFLLAHPRVCGHLRYMDDILWMCESREAARRSLEQFAEWLGEERGVRLKPETQINRSVHGVSYCGIRILPGSLRLSARKRMRYVKGRAAWERAWAEGGIEAAALQQGFDAVLATTLHADARNWRAAELILHGTRYNGV